MLFLGLFVAAQSADAARLFRYRDGHGVIHIGTSLPPDHAQLGYEVLDGRTLRTLDVVEPAPSADQLEQQATQKREMAAAEAAQKKVEQAKLQAAGHRRDHDRMLLQTYASEADITNLRDAKLESLELILRTTDNTIGHLRRNLAQMDATLAEHKAAGRNPPATLVRARAKTEADLAGQEQAATRTREEQAGLRSRFDRDLDRYRRLTGVLVTTASP